MRGADVVNEKAPRIVPGEPASPFSARTLLRRASRACGQLAFIRRYYSARHARWPSGLQSLNKFLKAAYSRSSGPILVA
jgi:hypothetical protein